MHISSTLKKFNDWKACLMACFAFVVVLLCAVACSGGSSVEETDTIEETGTISGNTACPASTINSISVEDLLRFPARYENECFEFTGGVLQRLADDQFIIGTKLTFDFIQRYDLDSRILVIGENNCLATHGGRVLENDRVSFVAVFDRLRETETVLGAPQTIPLVRCSHALEVPEVLTKTMFNISETAMTSYGLDVTVNSAQFADCYTYVDFLGEHALECAREGSLYLLANVTIGNSTSDSEFSFLGRSDFRATDNNNIEYETDIFYRGENELDTSDLLPNQTNTGVILFELPMSIESVQLHYDVGILEEQLLAIWELQVPVEIPSLRDMQTRTFSIGETATNQSGLSVTIKFADFVMCYDYLDFLDRTQSDCASDGMIYLIVDAEIENGTNDSQYEGRLNFGLLDSDNIVYDAGFGYRGTDELNSTDLQSGQRLAGVILFEIPDDLEFVQVTYEMGRDDSLFALAKWEIG